MSLKSKTFRLSHHHLSIIDRVKELKGMQTISDALRHILSEWDNEQTESRSIIKLIKKVEAKVGKGGHDEEFSADIIDALNEIRQMNIITLEALKIIGTVDSRTCGQIKGLLGEEI